MSTPTRFSKAPRHPELQLDGAIVLLPEQVGVKFGTREGGETRTGQRQRYAVDGKPGDPVTLRAAPAGRDLDPAALDPRARTPCAT